MLGNLIQFAKRDQIRVLGEETRRLGSASVESATYIQAELRAIDERLSALEESVASLRQLLEQQGGTDTGEPAVAADEIVTRPPPA
jgi:hypothetical protein